MIFIPQPESQLEGCDQTAPARAHPLIALGLPHE
jgi:hypothetical protein